MLYEVAFFSNVECLPLPNRRSALAGNVWRATRTFYSFRHPECNTDLQQLFGTLASEHRRNAWVCNLHTHLSDGSVSMLVLIRGCALGARMRTIEDDGFIVTSKTFSELCHCYSIIRLSGGGSSTVGGCVARVKALDS